MSILGVDYVYGAQGILDDPLITFVMRYLSDAYTKSITMAEVKTLQAHGKAIGLVCENLATDMQQTTTQFILYCERRINDARAVGAPAGVALYFANDTVTTPVNVALRNMTIAKTRCSAAGYRVGYYGPGDLGETLYHAGIVDFIWQAGPASWQGGTLSPDAVIYQEANGRHHHIPNVPDSQTDEDIAIALDRCGLWLPNPVPVPITTEDDVARVVSVAGSGSLWVTDGIFKWHLPDPDALRELTRAGCYGDGQIHPIGQHTLDTLVTVANPPVSP